MRKGEKRGYKTGGKVKGSRNKATIEKAVLAEQAIAQAIGDAKTGKKRLAIEVLYEMMMAAAGAATVHQPVTPEMIARGVPAKPEATWENFREWVHLASWCAAHLAKYETPMLRAIMVSMPGQAVEKSGPIIDNVIRLKDPNAASRVYAQIVTARKSA